MPLEECLVTVSGPLSTYFARNPESSYHMLIVIISQLCSAGGPFDTAAEVSKDWKRDNNMTEHVELFVLLSKHSKTS